MLEIDRLANMLKEAGITFRYYDGDFRPQYNYFRNQIIYPDCPRGNEVCSIIQGTYTYGGLENRLEIMGLLTEEEAENDWVCGWLTAENVFERIKAHWDSGERMSTRHISQCICGGFGHFAILKWENGKTVPVVYCSKCDRYTCLKNKTKDAAIDEWNNFNRVMSGGVLR